MVPSHLPQQVASANAPLQGAPGATDAFSSESSAEGAAFDCALDSVCTSAPQVDEAVPEASTQAGAAIMSDWWLSLGSEPSSAIGEDSSDDEDEDGNIAEDAAQNPAAMITADIQALVPATLPAQTQSPEPSAITSNPGSDDGVTSGVKDLAGRETQDARPDAEEVPESAPWTPQPVARGAASRNAPRDTTSTGTASTASPAASEVGQTASREHAPVEVTERIADLRATPAAMARADVARANREASTDDAVAAGYAAAQRTPAAATEIASSAARSGDIPTTFTPANQNAAQLPAAAPPAAAPLPERTAAVLPPTAVLPTASVLPAARAGHDPTGSVATEQSVEGQVEVEEERSVQTTAVAATITGSGAASQGRQDFSGTERQASQENPPAAIRFAGASPLMTLVVAPDGTFRLTPAPAAFILPPTLMSSHESTDNVDQMIQTMRVMLKESVTEATVHLRPEHFGEVRIEVRVDGKSVTARVQTDSAAVREWLQSQEAALRSGLSEQGLTLDRLQVERDPRHPRRESPAQQPPPRRQRRTPAGDPQQTFEVSV